VLLRREGGLAEQLTRPNSGATISQPGGEFKRKVFMKVGVVERVRKRRKSKSKGKSQMI
jgi:hypothetical protein